MGKRGKAIFAKVAASLLFAILVLSPARADELPTRIVAIGDLHGDHDAWLQIAGSAGLIDEDGDWSGGKTVLVQLGDVTDRGPDSLKIIRHLQMLEEQARADGGEVIAMLGNHEAMNVTGDLRYVHPGEYAAFINRKSKRRRDATWRANRERIENAYAQLDPPLSSKEAKARWYAETPLGKLEHRSAWAPGGELAEWAANRPAIVQIGTTIFAHGGLSAERSVEPIATINARIAFALSPGDEVDRSVQADPLGPLWYRGNLQRDESDVERLPIEEELAQVLAFYGAERLVVAHTPSIVGIASNHGGRVLQVDTGASEHYGGVRSYLEIIGEMFTAHERLWDGSWSARDLPLSDKGEEP